MELYNYVAGIFGYGVSEIPEAPELKLEFSNFSIQFINKTTFNKLEDVKLNHIEYIKKELLEIQLMKEIRNFNLSKLKHVETKLQKSFIKFILTQNHMNITKKILNMKKFYSPAIAYYNKNNKHWKKCSREINQPRKNTF
jgi:hypothetical protein